LSILSYAFHIILYVQLFSKFIYELLLIKISILFVELLKLELSCCTKQTVRKMRFSEFILILTTLPQEP